MLAKSRRLIIWNRASAAFGGGAWVAVLLLRLLSASMVTLDDLSLLLLLAVLVILPLAIPLASRAFYDPIAVRLTRVAILAQPLAALSGSIALVAPVGSAVAGIAAVIWLLFTALLGMLGLSGIARMLLERRVQLAETCLALALVYLPIGGIWFALARLGVRPLGFSQTIVLLTAVHFHFITLAALIVTGCTGLAMRDVQCGIVRNTYRAAAVGMLVCPLLVAAGITLTQVAGQRALESFAAVLLAFSLIVISLLSLRVVVPTTAGLLARALLVISGISVLLTMALAVVYAIGGATGHALLTVAQMIAIHGWLNAFAFGLCGLLGWRLKLAREA